MGLMLNHPEVAYRDCDHCRKWMYIDDGPGAGRIQKRFGLDVARPPELAMPCGACKKFPRDHPVSERSPETGKRQGLSERNRAALQHYRECAAVGEFPVDAVVRRNAALFHRIEEAHREAREEARHRGLIELVQSLLSLGRR